MEVSELGSLNKYFALNMFTEYDSALLVWSWFSEVMLFSLVLLQWDLDSSMHLLDLVKLTPSRTVWLIWWFLNTLANLRMNPSDYFQHMAVCFVLHPGFKVTKRSHISTVLQWLIWSLYANCWFDLDYGIFHYIFLSLMDNLTFFTVKLLIWYGLWSLQLLILKSIIHSVHTSSNG